MRIAIATAAALALAPVAASAQNTDARSFSDKVAALTETQRLGVMRRAILDGGEICKRPTAARLQGRWKNLIMWVARCEPGGDYGVFIGPNALVQVRQCGQMARLKLPICADPTKQPAAAPARR